MNMDVIKGLLAVVKRLFEDRFTGEVRLTFYRGVLSRKFYKKSSEELCN